MNKSNIDVLVVDLYLKENKGTIKECVIYASDNKGEISIQSRDTLEEIMHRQGYFAYQNRYTHGITCIENIEKYEIKTIKAYLF